VAAGVSDRAFVLNLADARARSHPRRASIVELEPEDGRFPEIGINVRVLEPGQPSGRYHSEPVQEDFLVLHGECLLIRDGEQRRLHQWDFVHCPARAAHVFVGAGEGSCAVLMIGSRRVEGTHYPVSELAASYDASVKADTDDGAEAYADWRSESWQRGVRAWPPA
jgi:uncharacterized cupin superfamily protein